MGFLEVMQNRTSSVSRLFVGLNAFERAWKAYDLSDEDRRALELMLLDDPKIGAIVQGTNRVRKVRHAVGNKGKSGGIRVFYYDFESLGRIYLLAVILKGDQENLTKGQRNQLGELIAVMKRGAG